MITFDDKIRLKDFGYRALLNHYHEAVPTIRRKTLSIPGRAGRWDFGSELESKSFEIPIKSLSKDSYDLQRNQNDLISFFMDELGCPRNVKISFDYEPDKHYFVKFDDSIAPNLTAHILSSKTLPFIANDPFKYSNVYADEVLWGSEAVTFEFHYLLGHEGVAGASGGFVSINKPQTLDVSVDGLAVKPIFEINGTANNLKISANGHSFTLPNFTNTKWIIDFERYVVFKNGSDTMIEIRDFNLVKGNNKISVAGSNIKIDMKIKFRDKYN